MSLRNVSMRSGMLVRSAGEHSAQSLEEGTDAMTRLFTPYDRLVGHPIDLDHATHAVDRLETVPGIWAVPEDEQRSFVGGNFGGVIIQIRRGPEDTKPASLRFVLAVHVKQHRDELRFAVGMNL